MSVNNISSFSIPEVDLKRMDTDRVQPHQAIPQPILDRNLLEVAAAETERQPSAPPPSDVVLARMRSRQSVPSPPTHGQTPPNRCKREREAAFGNSLSQPNKVQKKGVGDVSNRVNAAASFVTLVEAPSVAATRSMILDHQETPCESVLRPDVKRLLYDLSDDGLREIEVYQRGAGPKLRVTQRTVDKNGAVKEQHTISQVSAASDLRAFPQIFVKKMKFEPDTPCTFRPIVPTLSSYAKSALPLHTDSCLSALAPLPKNAPRVDQYVMRTNLPEGGSTSEYVVKQTHLNKSALTCILMIYATCVSSSDLHRHLDAEHTFWEKYGNEISYTASEICDIGNDLIAPEDSDRFQSFSLDEYTRKNFGSPTPFRRIQAIKRLQDDKDCSVIISIGEEVADTYVIVDQIDFDKNFVIARDPTVGQSLQLPLENFAYCLKGTCEQMIFLSE